MERDEKTRLAAQAAREARPRPSGWWRADCPFCIIRRGKGDTDKAFAIKVATGVYVCMRCGTSGKLDREASWPDEPTPEQLSELEKSARQPPSHFIPVGKGPGASARCTEPARAYLAKRGLASGVWGPAQLGACVGGRNSGRVVAPVLSDDGQQWLGWVGRDWSGKARHKYRNASGMPRERLLYNHAAIQLKTDEPCYVVEGAFDALYHWPNAVGLLGSATEEQIWMLSQTRRPLVVVLDGDALDLGWSLSARLQLEGVQAGCVWLPPRTDPDQVDRADLWEAGRASLGQLDAVRL